MTKPQDHDLGLKLRFRRILFCQGYWSPIEVELSQYEASGVGLRRKSLTDLDVLGIKYDDLFTPFRVVGDCKTGRNVSDASRLFWLKGVNDYFGADQAYFIHTTIENNTRSIAPKLGLRVLNEEALLALENNLEVGKFFLPLADIPMYNSVAQLWGLSVPKGMKPTVQQLHFKKVYSYLSYSYWYVEQHRNLFNIVDRFTEIAPLLDVNNPAHILLAYTGLERFAHSLLETVSFVFAQGGTNVPRDARSYMYGGAVSLREKETFFQTVHWYPSRLSPRNPPCQAATRTIAILNANLGNVLRG